MDRQHKNNLSDHLTYQAFKKGTQDLLEDIEHLHLATIKPLHWDYLRLLYYVIKVNRFTKVGVYFYFSQPVISRAL